MGNSGLKQHYETAKKTGAIRISVGLTEFPQGFSQLEPHLRVMDLAGNRFVTLPDEISAFKQLKRLNVSQNKLVSLPESIGVLSRLEYINACTNKITELPATLSHLTSLKEVHLSENRLTKFPSAFYNLKQLVTLDLSRNMITRIPDDVNGLYALELNLNQNQVSEISESIAKCPRLKTLKLQENCLQLHSIPKALLTDSNIFVLSVEGNLFDMKSFMELDGYEQFMERYTAVKKKMF